MRLQPVSVAHRGACCTTYLEVAQLCKLLPAVVELAGKRLDLLVHNLVCTHVAALSKCLAADVTAVRALSCVAPLMCLEQSARRVSAERVRAYLEIA